MTLKEVAELLTLASTVDSRNVAPENVRGWHEVIGRLNFEDAKAAMWAHFGESTAYLLPAHVVAGALRVKDRRAVTRGDVFCTAHDGYPMPCGRCEARS